jgi:DNA-binding CsgD family transcriptional regulator
VGSNDSPFALPSVQPGETPLSCFAPMCRRIRSNCRFGTYGEQQCIDCAFLDETQCGSNLETEFLKRCRGIRQFIEQTASEFFSSHVASILLSPSARILDCDQRGRSFLRTGGLLRVLHDKLCCNDPHQDAKIHDVITETAKSGRATTLLLTPPARLLRRYSLVLVRLSKGIPNLGSTTENYLGNVLCLVAPLDRRRIATASQLMNLFSLSAAEARLARALCHGDSLEEYATDQGLKLPTVKTQLRSIFAKTGTERQSSLIRVLSGIPVVRDPPLKPREAL